MSQQETINQITAPVAKVVTVWSLVGFSSLADAAAFATMLAGFLAALYSALLVGEFLWKRIVRPLFEHLKWIKPKPRYVLTFEEFQRLQNGETP